VKLRGASFLPHSFDRWLALQAQRFALMGTDEIQYFERFVQTNWHIADVGANQGIYTLFFSRLAPLGSVYAFEPDPSLFASLKENMRRNGANNLSLFNVAAASQTAKLSLRPGLLNRGDNRIVGAERLAFDAIEVDAIALDGAIPDLKLDLLKIDVQGFEVEVLRGAKKLLQTNPNLLILIEFWPHGLRNAGSEPEELLEILRNAGFSLFRLLHQASCDPFVYRARDWNRPGQFCNLIAARGQNP
jgi:FkbM family methyltransferase